MKQTADEDNFDDTVECYPLGLKRFYPKQLEAGDKFPSKFGENPPRTLTFVLSDEAEGGSYHDQQTESSDFMMDTDDWTQMIGERKH